MKTGSISPKFDVVCNDCCTTIPSRIENEQIKQDEWLDLLQFSRLRVIDDDDNDNEEVPNGTLNQDWLIDEEREIRLKKEQRNIPLVPIIDTEERLTEDAVDLPPTLPIVDK